LKQILAISMLITAMTLSTLVMAQGGGETPLTATTDIVPVCGLLLNPTGISFGSLLQDETSVDQVANVKNDGTETTNDLTIAGTDWTPASTPVAFLVDTTHYAESNIDYDSMTTHLSTTATTIHGGILSNQDSFDMHFKLKIPHGVTAASYTQTITFTSSCD